MSLEELDLQVVLCIRSRYFDSSLPLINRLLFWVARSTFSVEPTLLEAGETLQRSVIFMSWQFSLVTVFTLLMLQDIDSMTWQEVATKGSPPPPCYGHASVAVGNTKLLFFGGKGYSVSNAIHILDISMLIAPVSLNHS